MSLIDEIGRIIDDEKNPVTNHALLKLCGAAGIGDFSVDPHLCHEVAETALNFLVWKRYGKRLLSSIVPSVDCREILKPLQNRLPTQSWRSETQTAFQQFSTPVSIAYLAAYILNLNERDTVLEPSCGTGSLAVWALAAEAGVVTNEIDPKRRELATLVGLDPTGHDGEFIDDLLKEGNEPNVVLANPPFSSTGGRVDRNNSKFGFRHVESAFRRLNKGGRFAVILGESGSLRTVSGRRFWQSLLPEIQLLASIELPGSEYYRNGTTVPITLHFGRKPFINETGPAMKMDDHVSISSSSTEDAFEQAIKSGLQFDLTTE
jgi:predicted RNA methylase